MALKTYIANPLYDSVFKFLLEDPKVTCALLSALLKKKVVEVSVRPHEYSNVKQYNITVFRIDFAAKVLEDDGTEHLVLIELQKTWKPTETLRFRKYLGKQYLGLTGRGTIPADDEVKGDEEFYPIVSIYILGHKVGDITEPVIYVRRQYLDYDNHEITQGVPDPFVENLTHDSIIVQVPYLTGNVRNHLEKILSVFDQSNAVSPKQSQLLYVNPDLFTDDTDTHRIFDRLLYAATDQEVRDMMDIEDEVVSEAEEKDTKIMRLKDAVSRKDEQLSQKDEQLAKSIKMLASAGVHEEAISANLGIDISVVRDALK